MAEKKKSIIEEALLDASRIQEALNSNTKEILRSVAREEIDSLVKESLNEDDYDEEDVDDTEDAGLDTDISGGDDTTTDAGEETDDLELDNASDDYEEAGMDDTEGSEMNYGGDEESEEDYEMDMTGASDEDVISVYKKLSGDDEIEVVSDNEVHIKDPISGSEYHIKLGGGQSNGVGASADDMDMDSELTADTDMGMGTDLEDEYMDDSIGDEDTYEEGIEESVIYEIALEEKEVSENEELTEDKIRTATSDITMGKETSAPNTGDIEGQKAPVGNKNDDNWAGDNLEGGFDDDGQNGSGDAHAEHIMEEEEISEEDVVEGDENIAEKIQVGKGRNVTNGKTSIVGAGGKANNVKDGNVTAESVVKYNKLLAETNELRKQNEEFRAALIKFRTMLGETVVFNTNLTNVTRLFTEHSTTKEEKESIISRFDNEVSTIKESKRLYKIIASELSSKKPIAESIDNRISKEAGSSTSKQLTENTAYVDASTKRIMDLIQRVERPRD